MAGGWGSKKNGVRLGVFWDSIELNAAGSQGRITNARIRIDRDVNITDSTNSLSWSGGAVTDGSASNINVSGSGEKTIKNVTGQWQDLVYGSTKSANFAASMSGVDYAGGTISESRSVTYPARSYQAPLLPTNLAWVQNSPGNFTLSWTNQHSAAAPWTTVTLLRTEVGGATTSINVPNPTTATSIAQNGLALDKRYSWQIRITNPTTTVTSGSTTQTPIPLHTMTMNASSRAIGEAVTFTINKYGSPNTSTIYFTKNGVKTIVWDKQAGTSFAYTFTQADWAGFLPNETSKVFVVGIETFSGSTSLGVQTYNITVTVPNAAPYLPTAGAPTRTEQVGAVATAFGANGHVKGKSRIRYTWSGVAGASASITKREIILTRQWQVGTTAIDVTNASGYMYEEVPTGNGTVSVRSRTTDSRGRVVTSGLTDFVVYNYADPTITTFTVARCDSAGNLNNSGTYVKFTINVSASSVNTGSEQNRMQYRIRLLDSSGNETGSDIRTKALNATLSESVTTGALGGSYSAQAGYSFRLTLNDDLTNAVGVGIIRSASIKSEVYPLTIGDNGIAIGKVYNDSNVALDVVGKVKFSEGILSGSIGNAENLNNYITPGSWTQDANEQAASGSNYPTALAGLLEVTANSTASFVYQRYTTYSGATAGSNNTTYVRGRYNSVWSSWVRVRDTGVSLVAADIPNLDASKITAGTLGITRIPVITPAKMTAATETAIGAVERATNAEVLAGTDTTRYISPASLAARYSSWRGFRAYRSTDFNWNDMDAVITGWTEEYDEGGAFNNSTGVFTVPSSGLWAIFADVAFTSTSTRRCIEVYRNGTTIRLCGAEGANTGWQRLNCAIERMLTQGDQITLSCYTNGTTVIRGSVACQFIMRRVR